MTDNEEQIWDVSDDERVGWNALQLERLNPGVMASMQKYSVDLWGFVQEMSLKLPGDTAEPDIEIVCKFLAELILTDEVTSAVKPLVAWALGQLAHACAWMQTNKMAIAKVLSEVFVAIPEGSYGKGRTAAAMALIGGGAFFREWILNSQLTTSERVWLMMYAQKVMQRNQMEEHELASILGV